MGSTSAGKSTFLIRLPPAMRTFDDSSRDEENHVHGSRPQNRNSEYGDLRFGCRAGSTYSEHERVDQEQQQRVDERPEEAEHRPPVARLQLARDQALDELAVLQESDAGS